MSEEINEGWRHYYENAAGQYHGEFKSYYDSGQFHVHCHFNNGKLHGEYKRHDSNGRLEYHTYEVNDVEVHDFLEEDSEFIRTCLYMTHGAPWLEHPEPRQAAF